jgi:predicted ATPase/class 3 adenylate cyclase
MADLPIGTVSFLFTDLEGSTRRWEEQPELMGAALARHDAILDAAISTHGGVVFARMGDGLAAAFGSAGEAVAAAVDAQRGLTAEPWPAGLGGLRARMGVHTGDGVLVDGQYLNQPLNRCARLMAIGHGGQLLLSGSTAPLVRGNLPQDVTLDDLGEHHLRDLSDPLRVFQVRHPDLADGFPAVRSLDTLPGNLPRQMTSFVGREVEIAALADLVRGSSLVTLTGVGGVGKTRLALQVSAEVVTDFLDGAWLCELAAVSDANAVWETVAACLRVQPFSGRSLEESVLEHLSAKRLLLLLDNCEHLLDAVAGLVEAVTQRCPGVSVLATSREGLAVAGERIVAVPSLGVPSAGADIAEMWSADAVRLFRERAVAAKVDFVVTDGNLDAVGALCRRLDGIPLAIELAAARVRSLSPDDLLARLDQRFKLLTRGSRAALERQQTLRATIDWSYDLLEPDEREALDRLSVFAGSCDLGAAEAVLGGDQLDPSDVVDLLGQLVDKSLLVADGTDGGVRYRLLESIRHYAQERLEGGGETADVRRRHAGHYVEVAEAAGPHLRGRDQPAWADAVAGEADNFRAALDWAIETPSADHALRITAAVAVSGLAIGDAAMDWAESAVGIPGAADHVLYPVVAAWAAWGAVLVGDFGRARQRVDDADPTEVAGESGQAALARARAVLAFFQGDDDEARRQAERWVELTRASGDLYELANSLILLSSTLQSTRPDLATALLDQGVQAARDAGTPSALSIGLTLLAECLPLEESERALALTDEAIELGTRVGDRLSRSIATNFKGRIAARLDDWPLALRAAADAAQDLHQLGDNLLLSQSISLGAVALCQLGHYVASATLKGAAEAMATRHHERERYPSLLRPEWAVHVLDATDATLLAELGRRDLDVLMRQGAALSPAQCVTYLRTQAQQAAAVP